jgi:hypothetical protein
MTYMQSNLAFARGIQELSVDEIGFVSGGFNDSGEAPDKKDTKSLGIWKGACKWPVIKTVCAVVDAVGFVITANEIAKAVNEAAKDRRDENWVPKTDVGKASAYAQGKYPYAPD